MSSLTSATTRAVCLLFLLLTLLVTLTYGDKGHNKVAGSEGNEPTRSSTELQKLLDKHIEGTKEYESLKAKLFVRKIFEKYGHNGVMTFEAFEHLLANLGLADLYIDDHDIHDHFLDDGFKNLHPDHMHKFDNETETEEEGEDHDHDHEHEHEGEGHKEGHDKHEEAAVVVSTTQSSVGITPSTDLPAPVSQTAKNKTRTRGELNKNKPKNNKKRRKKKKKNRGRHKSNMSTTVGMVPETKVPLTTVNATSFNRTGTQAVTGVLLTSDNVTAAPSNRQRRYVELETEKKCLSASEILQTYQIHYRTGITEDNFLHLCPAMLYQIDVHACRSEAPVCPPEFHEDYHMHCRKFHSHGNQHPDDHNVTNIASWDFMKIPKKVWGFSSLAVTVISLVGLLGVAVVPIMQKVFYNQLLQFLVALAVGSLSGDALLHLIPHALTGGHDHPAESHDLESEETSHQEAVFKGLTALAGIYIFFIVERLLSMFTEWKRKRRKRKVLSAVHHADINYVGERLSDHSKHLSSCEEFLMVMHSNSSELKRLSEPAEQTEEEFKELTPCTEEDDSRDFTHSHSHGHGHHGHSHHGDKMPQTVASIAWMVIMGDGLHNFCDGLAIGAAFANSITGGLSTSIAVFCHELPHEIGDFALLLRAGMTVKQALTYNIISSVLCYMGMFIGVAVGNVSAASLWIFCLAAGMFIYIALVDMLPEITSMEVKEGDSKCCALFTQLLGISIGVAIMFVIAMYEDKIKISIGEEGT